MGKFRHSIGKKARKLSFKYSALSWLSVLIDKSKDLNIDELCHRYPEDEVLSGKQKRADESLDKVLSDIVVSEDFFIPKIIWIYWDKGLQQAPEIVQIAYKYWQKLNPDYEVRFLNEKNVQKYFDFRSLFYKFTIDAGVAHKSDFIRVYLLSRFGGVWVDSTTFCWKPLSDWIPEETKDCGLFMFKQSPNRKDRQIKNWFIAASKGNPVMVSLLKELIRYNFKQRSKTLFIVNFKAFSHLPGISREGTGFQIMTELEKKGGCPYFYFHYLFNEVVKGGREKQLWDIAKLKRNNHRNAGSEIDDALVSKQNYKPKYMASEEYKARVALLETIKP